MFLNEKYERWEVVTNSDSGICSPESQHIQGEGMQGMDDRATLWSWCGWEARLRHSEQIKNPDSLSQGPQGALVNTRAAKIVVLSLVLACSNVVVVGCPSQLLTARTGCPAPELPCSLTSGWRSATRVSISANCEGFRLSCGHLSCRSQAETPGSL